MGELSDQQIRVRKRADPAKIIRELLINIPMLRLLYCRCKVADKVLSGGHLSSSA